MKLVQLVTYDATTTDASLSCDWWITHAQNYFVIRVDENTIQLATSANNANNGNAIPLTSTGSGSTIYNWYYCNSQRFTNRWCCYRFTSYN